MHLLEVGNEHLFDDMPTAIKGNKYKSELESLQREHDSLKALMTPEMQDAMALQKEIFRLQEELSQCQNSLGKLQDTIDTKNNEIHNLDYALIIFRI